MTDVCDVIRVEHIELPAANRPRLARYLGFPSVAQVDPVTDEEIRRLDAQRGELVAPWSCAVALPIARINGCLVEFDAEIAPVEATPAFTSKLAEHGADALIVAAFTLGDRVDEQVKAKLDQQELFEAYVLKQWAATMAEQARVELSGQLRAWSESRCRSLLPYDGPGYNGWPLETAQPLLAMLYDAAQVLDQPIVANPYGALAPINSMLIVYGVMPRADETGRHESLAQCHRCSMRNCRFRTSESVELLAAATSR